MFQINWKLKALLYKVFEVFKLNKTLYFVQRYITGRAKIQFTTLNPHWKRHAVSIQEKNCKSILEIGAGKSLEQNIFFSYYFDNSKFQKVIDINNMINLELCNEASHRIAKLLNKDFKGKIKNIRDLKNNYNIYYEAPCKVEDIKMEKFDICTSTTSLEHFSLDDLKKHYAFYETYTVHESSLSPCIHCIESVRLGCLDQAHSYFLQTARLDLNDYNKEVHEGLHVTSMAGTWMSLIEGFAGVKIKNGLLNLAPKISDQWTSYSFHLNYRDCLIFVEVTHEKTNIHLIEGEEVKIILNDEPHQLSNQKINIIEY